MSTILPGFQQDWTSNGAPGSTIVLGQGGSLFVNDRVLDTTSNKLYRCLTVGSFNGIDTYTGCSFSEIADDENIESIIFKGFGDVTLSLGVATVSFPSLLSGDNINLSYKTPSGTRGAIFVSSVTPGTGFTINSTSLLDSSIIHWEVFNN